MVGVASRRPNNGIIMHLPGILYGKVITMNAVKREEHEENVEIVHLRQDPYSKKVIRVTYDRRILNGSSRLWKMVKIIFSVAVVLLMLLFQNTGITMAGEKMKSKNLSINKSIELNKMGLKSISDRKYDEAIEKFTGAIRIYPENSPAYCNRGLAYLHKRKYDKAIRDFNRALKIDPELVEAYNNRGIAYYLMTKYGKATEDFDRAISLNRKFVKAYINRGLAYCDGKKYKKAIEDFNIAIKLDPKSWMAYNNRGLTYHLKGEEKKGLADVNKSLKIHPRFRVSFYGRDIAYARCNYSPRGIKR